MRIGIFTNNYLPNPYGVAGSVESFRKEFEALGHKVFIFAPKWKGYMDRNPNVYRYSSVDIEIKIKFPLAIPYSRKISGVLENLDLDIIHSQHPNLLGSAAARWARKYNIPLVFTWHTLYDQYAHFVPFIPRRLASWWTIRNARNYANRCDAVITPTESVIGIIKKWGVTNKNITAIPTGVEEKQFTDPNRDAIRRKHNIQSNEVLLIVVTRLTAEKNVEFLLDAVLPVLKRNSLVHPHTNSVNKYNQKVFRNKIGVGVKFLVCGEGDLKKMLQRKVSQEDMDNRIIFEGILGDSKKNYYAAGDIFVYASKSETQGMILTEAMYAGLPIVAVRATGVQDIVEDGKTGFLVQDSKKEFGDAVQKLIDDENLRKSFGAEAERIAREKYTSSVCSGKLLEIYKKLIIDCRLCRHG